MADRTLPWFRLYSEIISDRKITMIARLSGHSKAEVIGAFTVLMCLASESPKRGVLLATENIRYSVSDISHELGLDEEETEELLGYFEKLEMITVDDGGISIRNWDKRQYKSDDSNERVTRYRVNRKSNADVTLQNSYSNADVTPPDNRGQITETESDNNNSGRPGEIPAIDGVAAEVFRKFENEICLLTPGLAAKVGDWIDDYPADWIKDAIDAAVNANVRKPNYIAKVLQNWKANGRNGTKPEKAWIPEEHASEVY